MQTINTVRELLDEIPVLREISKDLPFPCKLVITQKINELNNCLEVVHTQALENPEKQTKAKNKK